MEKTLNYLLTPDGIFQDDAVCGGVQGEHRATAIEITPDDELVKIIDEYKSSGVDLRLHVDAVTAAGEVIKGERREENLFDPIYIDRRMTESGLDITLLIRIFIIGEDVRELVRGQIRLYFKPSCIAFEGGLELDEEESEGFLKVDQTYDPTSKNAQSGIAVSEAVEEMAEHVKYEIGNLKTDQTFDGTSQNAQSGKAIEERLKSKVLLNTTLTEAQAGASVVSLAIPDWESLRKAKQWNIQIVFPYSGEYNANALSFGLVLHDSQKSAYNSAIANGQNVKFPSAYNLAYWNITVFNTTYQDGTGMLVSNYIPPHPWARISAANSSTTLRGSNWLYLNHCITAERPPYLELKNDSNFVFEAGTRIYLEVVL